MLCKMETHTLDRDNLTAYYRTKLDNRTQKAYNRFKNFVREEMNSIDVTGYGKRTFIRGDGYHITVVKSVHYLHITVTMNRRHWPDMVRAMRFFGTLKEQPTST
jgi:hypothetical protein